MSGPSAPVNQKLHVEKVENHEVTPLTKLPRLTLNNVVASRSYYIPEAQIFHAPPLYNWQLPVVSWFIAGYIVHRGGEPEEAIILPLKVEGSLINSCSYV